MPRPLVARLLFSLNTLWIAHASRRLDARTCPPCQRQLPLTKLEYLLAVHVLVLTLSKGGNARFRSTPPERRGWCLFQGHRYPANLNSLYEPKVHRALGCYLLRAISQTLSKPSGRGYVVRPSQGRESEQFRCTLAQPGLGAEPQGLCGRQRPSASIWPTAKIYHVCPPDHLRGPTTMWDRDLQNQPFGPPIDDFAPAHLIEAIEASTRAFLLALGHAGGAEERDEPDLQWVSGVPRSPITTVLCAPPHPGVLRCRNRGIA